MNSRSQEIDMKSPEPAAVRWLVMYPGTVLLLGLVFAIVGGIVRDIFMYFVGK